MNGDSTTRLLLAGILVALLVLIVRGSGPGGSSAVPGALPGGEPEWGRYQISATRAGAPILFRTDTLTGQVSKLELRGGGGLWHSFQEPEEGGAEVSGWGRYFVTPMKAGSPMLIRADTVTGQVWQLELRGGDGVWLPFEDAEEDSSPTPLQPAAEEPAAATPPRTELPSPPTNPAEELESYLEAASGAELPPGIRIWAIGKLAAVDDPKATSALLGALEAEEADVALAALAALDGRDDERIEAALESAADHADPAVQAAAAERLDAR